MKAPDIHIDNISYKVRPNNSDEKSILNDISMVMESGTASLITGATGSGKSTLLHSISGILRPTAGSIVIGGDQISHWTSAWRDAWRRSVGIVMQVPQFLEDLSVLENVMLPLIPQKHLSLTQKSSAAMQALQQIHIADMASTDINRLSGGERQRVALARAIVNRPTLLLLDEPSSYQDDTGVERIKSCIETHKITTTTVVASHDPRLKETTLYHQTLHLNNGRLQELS